MAIGYVPMPMLWYWLPLITCHKNLEILDALKARGVPTTCLALLDDRQSLSADAIANSFSHVSFLLLGDYPTHYHTFTEFLTGDLTRAKELDPTIRIINGPAMSAWNADKLYLEELSKEGFSVPSTAFLDKRQPSDYLQTALYNQSHGEPVVLKPSIGASGKRTHLVKDPQQLTDEDHKFLDDIVSVALNSSSPTSVDMTSSSKNRRTDGRGKEDGHEDADQEEPENGTFGCFMMQEYMHEVENGEYSLCFVAGQYRFTVLKRPRLGGFNVGTRYGGSRNAVAEDDVPRDARKLGAELIKWIEEKFTAEAVDYARIDGVVRSDGTFTLMEVELIEPSLFFSLDVGKKALDALCDLLVPSSSLASDNLRPTASAP